MREKIGEDPNPSIYSLIDTLVHPLPLLKGLGLVLLNTP
jgi:hypothetical protein